MSKWKKFTRSKKQIEEIMNAKYGIKLLAKYEHMDSYSFNLLTTMNDL
jgi:hypothetical protein